MIFETIISFEEIEEEIFLAKDKTWIKPVSRDRYKITRAWVEYWKKYDNEYCRKGDEICTAFFKNDLTKIEKIFYSEHDGLLETTIPRYEYLNHFSDGQILFSVNTTKDAKQETLFQSTKDRKVTEVCYLYLMHDTTNGFYKIGISNNPEYREKTLQSEKPTIELISSKPYPNRDLARSFEKGLHSNYSANHLRGEWFSLSEEDVEDIKKVLS